MTTLTDRISANYKRDPATVGVKAVVADVSYEPKAALVTALANTAAVDQADEVVVPEGAERDSTNSLRYMAQMRSIYFNHDYGTLPVGTFRNARLTPAGWKVQFRMTGATPLSRDLIALFALGDDNPVRGVSIGFVRTEAGEPTDAEIAKYGRHTWITRRWLWLELSVTPMPCNPEAMIEGVVIPSDDTVRRIEALAAKGIITKASARLMGVPEPKAQVTVPRMVTVKRVVAVG